MAVDVTVERAFDGFQSNPRRAGDPDGEKVRHIMDSPDNRRMLGRLEDWWQEARDQHAVNRRAQMLDADYYDTIQWLADDAAVLHERGQAALSFPLVKQVCDWIIGTERRTRIDWDVLPRKEEDVELAHVKKEVLKWVSDINGAGWERSKQFADVVKVGIGWIEEVANNDDHEEAITLRYVDWKHVWWDPYSRDNTLRDCRYVTRAKWLDLDYAISMFPDREDELRSRAVSSLGAEQDMADIEDSLPAMFFGTSNPLTAGRSFGSMSYGPDNVRSRSRQRVLCLETWFKRAQNTAVLMGDGAGEEKDGQPYDPTDPEVAGALGLGTVSLVDSVTEQMWFALWTPGALLRVNKTPYEHRQFPFTPSWGYRRHRDGMPYGAVRPARDAQDEYNKRRAKILYDLSTNRVKYETDAMDEADENRNLDEAKRPDAEIRLSPGGMDKFQIEGPSSALTGQMEMLSEARQNIYEASGVTRENTGTSGGSDQSGRAILAKQQQGSVTTAELFDNYRQAIQVSGQKMLSLTKQFITLPKLVRIAGTDGAMKWESINEPAIDPMTGEVIWNNDITADEADFVVDQSDYRETVRMAMSEMLFELIGKMPGEAGIQLLDIAVDMTDLPNKAALAKRIRSLNQQAPPGSEQTPEQQQQAMQAQQAQQQEQEMQKAAQRAKTRLDESRADKATAEAQRTGVQGKADAMDTAGMVAAALPLAPAADRLWNPPPPVPPATPNQ